MTLLCPLSIANCTWSSDNNARGWKLLHEQASFAYFFVLCLIELKMNAVKLPCFMPEWNKRKRICFECHNCLPLNFPAKGQFYWRCWFEYRAIGIKPHRNRGRGFRQKKKSVRIHLQLLVTESHTDRCHPFTKLPQYAGLVIFFWSWLKYIKAEILSRIVHAFIYSLSSLKATAIIVIHIFTPELRCLGSDVTQSTFIISSESLGNTVATSWIRCNLCHSIPENWFWWPSLMSVEDYAISCR